MLKTFTFFDWLQLTVTSDASYTLNTIYHNEGIAKRRGDLTIYGLEYSLRPYTQFTVPPEIDIIYSKNPVSIANWQILSIYERSDLIHFRSWNQIPVAHYIEFPAEGIEWDYIDPLYINLITRSLEGAGATIYFYVISTFFYKINPGS